MSPPRRIEISGGIAAGKTTLAQLIGERVGIQPVLEDFEANPFWAAFYSEPGRHAFETETTFLLQHYHDIKTASSPSASVVCDNALLLDLAYAEVGLAGSQRAAFQLVYEEVLTEVGDPDLLIQLDCSPRILHERIQARERTVDASVSQAFLTDLCHTLDDLVASHASRLRVLRLDAAQLDFAHDPAQRQIVLDEILATWDH